MTRFRSRCILPADTGYGEGGQEMPPLFMESGSELNSPGSVSGASNTGASEREGGRRVGSRGRKRQENNRTAARKSRRKQTERADELHEELQCMERANSAIKKEIAALKKDLHLYTTALEHHRPFCCLRDSASNPTDPPAVSPCSPPGGPAGTAGPRLSRSLTSRLDLQSRDCVEGVHLSRVNPPPPGSTTLGLRHAASAEPSGSAAASGSAPFSEGSTPCPLLSGDPPPAISTRRTNVPPVRTGPGSPSRLGGVGAHFSALHPAALDEFLSTQASFLPAPAREVPLDPHYPLIASQLCTGPLGEDSGTTSLSRFLLPPTLRDPSPQSLSRPPPPPALAMELSYGHPAALNGCPLLSMLTIPSSLNAPQTTSCSFHEPGPQNPPSLPMLGDTSRDLSLSELLEVNDWILSGSIHQ